MLTKEALRRPLCAAPVTFRYSAVQHLAALSTSSPSNIASLLRRHQPTSSADTTSGSSEVGCETVSINAFVRTVRKQKRVAFAAVGDGSSLESVQVVMSPEQASGLSTGAGVAITGQWRASPSGKQQAHELHAHHVRLLGQHDAATYPLQKKYHSPEFLRTLPHLRARLPFNSLMLRLRSHVIAEITSFFSRRDFVQTHPPIITSSDCEGAGEVFSVSAGSTQSPVDANQLDDNSEGHFFRSPKYLTVSSQLHLEALAQSVGKVWTLSPTFRAEKSDTPRHLSEFYMLEAEVSFVENLDDVMDIVEEMLREVANALTDSTVGKELLLARSPDWTREDENTGITPVALSRRWEGLRRGPWPRITYAEAVLRLQDAESQGRVTFDFKPSFDEGFQAEHERFLAEYIGQGGPVFVTDYPSAVKPFYMAPSTSSSGGANASSTVACFDLLVPEICELVGGSMREHRLPELLAAMTSHGLRRPDQDEHAAPSAETPSIMESRTSIEPESLNRPDNLQWYVDLRRYGSVPHGGFGIGFDRLLGYLSGVSNIRDVVGFPRWYQRCDC